MSETAIRVRNVSKSFRVYYDKPATLKDYIIRFGRGDYKEFKALSDVSFEIKKGETLGIVGKNGSGKSTLLKILNKTLYPDKGFVEIYGKVASLIELGAGFHPDMTGRENIYNNASIFGLTKQQIERRIPSIVEFSELHDFIDNPVRTYSSGMYARLAFSVAIHVDADVLLVDEILSVGDMNFQAKCNNHILELQKAGVTIIIVTHDMGSMERICDRAILLEHGRLVGQGGARDVRLTYMEHMASEFDGSDIHTAFEIEQPDVIPNEPLTDLPTEPAPGLKHWGNQYIVLRGVKMLDAKGNDKRVFITGEDIIIKYNYFCTVDPELLAPNFGFGISKTDGTHIYGTNTMIDNLPPLKLKKTGTMEIRMKKVALLPGDYSLQIAVVGMDNTQYDFINDIARFRMMSSSDDVGITRVDHTFILDGKRF